MRTALPSIVSAAVIAGLRAVLESPDASDVRNGLRVLVRSEVRAALAERERAARKFLDTQANALRELGEMDDREGA